MPERRHDRYFFDQILQEYENRQRHILGGNYSAAFHDPLRVLTRKDPGDLDPAMEEDLTYVETLPVVSGRPRADRFYVASWSYRRGPQFLRRIDGVGLINLLTGRIDSIESYGQSLREIPRGVPFYLRHPQDGGANDDLIVFDPRTYYVARGIFLTDGQRLVLYSGYWWGSIAIDVVTGERVGGYDVLDQLADEFAIIPLTHGVLITNA